ncbi:MAG: HPr family phosphocarrier protein [Clostridia bacterium]|nr:HPr family phosphocarrier protein [Clostridia bacterium]
MERTITVSMDGELLTREAAKIAERMMRYRARVLLSRENITVNGKSLMGLVSVGLRDGVQVTILTEGEDAEQAARELARLLGA